MRREDKGRGQARRTFPDDEGEGRALPRVPAALQHDALRRAAHLGLQVRQLGLPHDRLHQLREPLSPQCGHLHHLSPPNTRTSQGLANVLAFEAFEAFLADMPARDFRWTAIFLICIKIPIFLMQLIPY